MRGREVAGMEVVGMEVKGVEEGREDRQALDCKSLNYTSGF